MATPEGRVKAKVRKLLGLYQQGMYTYWPVPMGFGKSTLDVLGCYRGRFFAVETKKEGKQPTLRQVGELVDIGSAMGKTFVIVGVDSPVFEELRSWLDETTSTVPYAPHQYEDPVNRGVI